MCYHEPKCYPTIKVSHLPNLCNLHDNNVVVGWGGRCGGVGVHPAPLDGSVACLGPLGGQYLWWHLHHTLSCLTTANPSITYFICHLILLTSVNNPLSNNPGVIYDLLIHKWSKSFVLNNTTPSYPSLFL